jgi:hypothetical protein
MTTNDTALDTVTGRMWQRLVPAESYTWQQAKDYCDVLELGGYSDWRLPSRIELVSIVNYTKSDPAIDMATFPGATSAPFWSLSVYAGESCAAWYVHFTFGYVSFDSMGNFNRVRCIR